MCRRRREESQIVSRGVRGQRRDRFSVRDSSRRLLQNLAEESSAKGELWLRNRQSKRRVNLRFLRRVLLHLTGSRLSARFDELGFSLLSAAAMARINEDFLRHAGSTDVITFDYHARRSSSQPILGEVLICVDEAVAQARSFRTSWQSEVVRYAVHGLLHLEGFDDRRPASRRRMKRTEDQIMRTLSRTFPLRSLAAKT